MQAKSISDQAWDVATVSIARIVQEVDSSLTHPSAAPGAMALVFALLYVGAAISLSNAPGSGSGPPARK